MTDLTALMDRLRDSGIDLWLEDDAIRFRARDALPPGLRDEMKANREGIRVVGLRAAPCVYDRPLGRPEVTRLVLALHL